MGSIPRNTWTVHTGAEGSARTSLRGDSRPADDAGSTQRETRTPIAWRLKGTGLKGASCMLPHARSLTHCSVRRKIPVALFATNFHRLGHCQVAAYASRRARRAVERPTRPASASAAEVLQ